MRTILTHLAAFVVGVVCARVFWASAISKGKEELAKAEAKLKSIFDPVKPPAPPTP